MAKLMTDGYARCREEAYHAYIRWIGTSDNGYFNAAEDYALWHEFTKLYDQMNKKSYPRDDSSQQGESDE